MISEVDIKDMKNDEKQRWIDKYVAEMARLGFDLQFSTECAEASFDNKDDDFLTPEEMVHEDLSCWED